MPKEGKETLQEKAERRDEETRIEIQRQREKREKKMKQPFVPQLARLLFLLELLLVVGFGVVDITRLAGSTYTFSAAYLLSSLLAGGAIVGVPLLLLCFYQLRREKNGTLPQNEQNTRPIQIYARITLGLMAALAVGWLVTALAGV